MIAAQIVTALSSAGGVVGGAVGLLMQLRRLDANSREDSAKLATKIDDLDEKVDGKLDRLARRFDSHIDQHNEYLLGKPHWPGHSSE